MTLAAILVIALIGSFVGSKCDNNNGNPGICFYCVISVMVVLCILAFGYLQR